MKSVILSFFLLPSILIATEADSLRMEKKMRQAESLFFEGGSLDSVIYYFEHASEYWLKQKDWGPLVYTHLARFQAFNTFRELDKSEYHAFKAVELAQKHLPPKHIYQFHSLSNLGVHYYQNNNYQKAIEIAEDELELLQTFPSNKQNWRDIADVRLLLGTYRSAQGDYQRAIQIFMEAERILLDSVGLDKYSIQNMGHIKWRKTSALHRLEDYEQQEKYLIEGIKFLEKHDTKNLFAQIRMRQSLANSLVKQGRAKEALSILESVEPLQESYKKQKGRGLMQGEIFYWVKAQAFALLEQPSEGILAFEESIKQIKESLKGPKRHPRIGFFVKAYADFMFQKGESEKTLELYNEALKQYLPEQIKPETLESLELKNITQPNKELIEILRRRNQIFLSYYEERKEEAYLKEAWKSIKLQNDLIDQLRSELFAEGSHLFLSSQALPTYEQGILIGLKMANLYQDESYKFASFSFAEKAKAVLLYSSLRQLQFGRDQLDLENLLHELDLKTQEVSQLKTRVFKLERKADLNQDEKLKELKQRLFYAEEKLIEIKERLRENAPEYFNFIFSPPFSTLKDIRKKLQPQEGLVEYFWGNNTVYLFYLDQNNFEIREIERSKILDSKLKSILAQLHSQSDEDLNEFVNDASYLFEALLKPELAEYVPEKLKIIPDGPLGHLSFEVLLNDPAKELQGFQNLPYLGKSLPISYAYSVNLMLMDVSTDKRKQSSDVSCLGFAPSFLQQVNLSFSEKELQAVQKSFIGNYLSAESATASRFKELAPNYQYLHLSTHGFPELDNPAFAHLVFATENGTEDSYLYAHELAQLPLQAELTVLSACESGYGEWAKGEGIMSLARSFRFAGSKSILSSLWKADGGISKDLMGSFYEAYAENYAKDEALQKAKFEFLKEARPNQVHPRHWANFVLIGDTKAMGSWWDWGRWGMIFLVVLLGGVGILRIRSS